MAPHDGERVLVGQRTDQHRQSQPVEEPASRRASAGASIDPAALRSTVHSKSTAAGHNLGHVARRLGGITAPTLIINGADDPLIRPSAGAALARRIPGARAVVHPRVGHLLPEHAWTTTADAIAAHAGITTPTT